MWLSWLSKSNNTLLVAEYCWSLTKCAIHCKKQSADIQPDGFAVTIQPGGPQSFNNHVWFEMYMGVNKEWRNGITDCTDTATHCNQSSSLCRCRTTRLLAAFSSCNSYQFLTCSDYCLFSVVNIVRQIVMPWTNITQIRKKIIFCLFQAVAQLRLIASVYEVKHSCYVSRYHETSPCQHNHLYATTGTSFTA